MTYSIIFDMLLDNFAIMPLGTALKVLATACLYFLKVLHPKTFRLASIQAQTFSIGSRSGLFGGQLGSKKMLLMCWLFHLGMVA